jgi:hypothetical protein
MTPLPHQILAASLGRARQKSQKGMLRSQDLPRADRELLEREGWLMRIIRGWYLLKQPSIVPGDTTPWYSSFWDFMSLYLTQRFGKNYCISANASIDLHLGSTVIPKQIVVMVKKGSNSIIHLLFNTSIVIYQEKNAFPEQIEFIHQLNVMPLALALQRIPSLFFSQEPMNAEIALRLVNLTAMSRELLKTRNLAVANRLIGAYYFIGEIQGAKQLSADLQVLGYTVDPVNPFLIKEPLLKSHRIQSPYAARILILWKKMREDILSVFSKESKKIKTTKAYFTNLEKIYGNDAYNSLSIEGYEVTENLVMQIAKGSWDPHSSVEDKNQVNAMAAKGYRQAFEAVKLSIDRVFDQENSGTVIRGDLHSWYSALFAPSVKAGILKPEQLAGYRTQPVYIRGSLHTPLPVHALTDAMDTFFECVMNEPHGAVRAILGHFIFVFIHPYMDGNGRLGRFIMNTLFASGGFPWTIVKVAHREKYLATLEEASVEQNIKPFAQFILSEMKDM